MKRKLSSLLALALLCTMLPQMAQKAEATEQYNAQSVVDYSNALVGSTWPNGYCLGYIATVFYNVYGLDGNVYSSCCAYQNGSRYIISTTKTDIPLGACVYFGGSDVICSCGNYAGHIAIHVGNGNVVHAWAGSIVCTSIDYVINCGYPYRGYGWYAHQVLTTTCSHNYEIAETPASCTQDGKKVYTCTVCGDSYSETMPAPGHDYTSVVTTPTCDKPGYTTYTCSACGGSYVEYGDGWSEWSEDYPTGVSENLIVSKTQYSSRLKEYTTSESDSLDGWTYSGKTYSDWGSVQTTTIKPTESDTLQITATTQTGWGYYHWCNNYNDSGSWGVDSIDCAGASYYHSYVSGTELPQFAFADQGGQTAYGGTGSGASACAYNFYAWFRDTSADVYTYSYQTKSELNLFYKWTDDWSDWSDEQIASGDDCEVKTRTVYAYYTSELADHNYSYAVTKAPTESITGTLSGTCSTCQESEDITLPVLNKTDYTYSQITAPTATAEGLGRYTWNTTAYGSYSFDVMLLDLNQPRYEMAGISGRAGSTVEVYVAISNNPGIISLRQTISYDTSALELSAVENLGLLAGYTTPSAIIGSPYTLRWADSLATQNNTSNGNIAKLTFTIKEDVQPGSYEISVSPVEARNVSGEKVSFGAASAAITVVEYIVGDTDGDGEISDWDAIVLNRYLAGWNVDTALAAADVDGDGEVTDWDAIVLERYLAGWNVELNK